MYYFDDDLEIIYVITMNKFIPIFYNHHDCTTILMISDTIAKVEHDEL